MFKIVLVASSIACSLGAILPNVPKINNHIVGGEVTTISNAPYQVSLMIDIVGSGIFIHVCGGSIIRPDVILTSADCVYYPADIDGKIRAGSTFFASGGVIADISHTVAHENFNRVDMDFDYGLIFLTEMLPVDGVTISTVQLPTQGQAIMTGSQGYITGWGSVDEDATLSESIRKVAIPIVDQAECAAVHFSLVRNITDRMVCAGHFETGGQDACYGDYGGPMTIDEVLVGITSWGFGCARANIPGVWARVPLAMSWINANLAANLASKKHSN